MRLQYNMCKSATLKKDRKLVLKSNDRLMQVRSIAKYSKWPFYTGITVLPFRVLSHKLQGHVFDVFHYE